MTTFGRPHRSFGLLTVIVMIYGIGSYLVNIYYLTKCDFDPKGSWRGEVIHALGVVLPPAAMVTALMMKDR